jgi:hypothetical protein
MASSSSNSFNSSTASESSWEMTPEFDFGVAHEACALLHWDAEEWDFRAWSEDNESLTDGEDSSSFSTVNWKTRTTMMTRLGMGMTPPRKRRKTTSRLRRTRRQGVSCAPGHPMKTTTETMAGTPKTEPIVMMAPPVKTVLEMMAATGAVAMAMSAQVLRSSVVGS